MNIVLYSDKIDEYLKHDDVIDYENEAIAQLADTLFQKASNEQEFIKLTYEFVRDKISHSADINEDTITCTASEVLKAGHGICFAKSHLLAALLRCKSVPTGFCYQKLILDDETAPVLIYHGLNGVYIKDCQKWIRLDARGNKPGVNAQFSVETEQLAFPVRPEMGEEDNFIIYPDPDIKVLEKLRKSKTRTELWDNLPIELEYDTDLKHNTDLEHNYV
ncbi:MAG: transglutaminase-like domain-containing protein [Lachnospiraceae bacterium]|nr:transglutaminase-like domain-containing protein [Lachnospiraceae bacterium]